MTLRRLALAAATLTALALGAPAAAQANDLQVAVVPADATYGAPHTVEGRLTDAAGAPLAGQEIVIRYREFPYTGTFAPLAVTKTGADGRFSAGHLLLWRNADVRAVAADGTTSGIARAWTYPSFALAYRPAGRDRIRLIQAYRTPSTVRLSAPTLFYVGPASSASGPVRARAKTRRTAPGRFVATATLKLPKAWKGSFRFASCFRYSEGSGMGDPARGCPTRLAF